MRGYPPEVSVPAEPFAWTVSGRFQHSSNDTIVTTAKRVVDMLLRPPCAMRQRQKWQVLNALCWSMLHEAGSTNQSNKNTMPTSTKQQSPARTPRQATILRHSTSRTTTHCQCYLQNVSAPASQQLFAWTPYLSAGYAGHALRVSYWGRRCSQSEVCCRRTCVAGVMDTEVTYKPRPDHHLYQPRTCLVDQ